MRIQFLSAAQLLALYFVMHEGKDVVSISELSDFRVLILKRINDESVSYIIESSSVNLDRTMIDYSDCFGYSQSETNIILKTNTDQLVKRIVAYLPNKLLRAAFKKDDV